MTHPLIVNADDYGHTPGVSEGIRLAHLQGIVTSTTAMMNRPAAVIELPAAMANCPNLGLGVHLVLTTGVPVLPADRVPSLVDGEGRFHRREAFIERLASLDLEEIAAEWHAQVDRFVKTTGQLPDHLDSHHHCSYFSPALLERMLFLAEELRCPIRNPYADVTCPPGDYLPGGQAQADLMAVSELFGKFSPAMPKRFFSNFYDDGVSLESLGTLLHQVTEFPEDQVCELMCHPAVVDAELREVSDYHDMRARELTVLTNPNLPVLLQGMQIELANYQTGTS
jgi:predicted glycoside hydrolase/deacetylase ChbG (UPF0249 family)